jgi:hypothetical protein
VILFKNFFESFFSKSFYLYFLKNLNDFLSQTFYFCHKFCLNFFCNIFLAETASENEFHDATRFDYGTVLRTWEWGTAVWKSTACWLPCGRPQICIPLSTGLHVAVAQPHLFMSSNVKTQDLCIVCFIAWTRNEDLAHAKEQATHLGFMHMHRDEFGSDTHEYEFSVTIYHILIQIQIQIQILSNTNTKQIFRICNWLLTRFIA